MHQDTELTDFPPIVIPDELASVMRPSLAAEARRLALATARAALDLVFPPSCLACGAAVAEAGRLCPACWRKIRFIERPYCERLGIPFERDLGQALLSAEAIADPPDFDRARAVACFDEGPVRDLVHRLKYSDRIDLARPMGRWMARAGADLLGEADLLIPIPLHRRRLWQRRFNQAQALAQAIAEVARLRVDGEALERIKATPPQVRLSRAARIQNVEGAFRVTEAGRPRILGQKIVVIDDVLTSGATLNAAARALRRAGAERVDVLVFARVVGHAGLPI